MTEIKYDFSRLWFSYWPVIVLACRINVFGLIFFPNNTKFLMSLRLKHCCYCRYRLIRDLIIVTGIYKISTQSAACHLAGDLKGSISDITDYLSIASLCS